MPFKELDIWEFSDYLDGFECGWGNIADYRVIEIPPASRTLEVFHAIGFNEPQHDNEASRRGVKDGEAQAREAWKQFVAEVSQRFAIPATHNEGEHATGDDRREDGASGRR